MVFVPSQLAIASFSLQAENSAHLAESPRTAAIVVGFYSLAGANAQRLVAFGYTGAMMSSTERSNAVDAIDTGWQQLEEFVDRLHALARAPVDAATFYRQLLEGCATTLAATGGAVWRQEVPGRWQVVHQINLDQVADRADAQTHAAHLALLQQAAKADQPLILSPRSGSGATPTNPTDAVIAIAAVDDLATVDEISDGRKPQAIVELFLRTGSSPAAQEGWSELLSTVCQIAADFHLLDQLRTLRSERRLERQSVALLERIHGPTDLQQTAFEIANEGRRFTAADRLSLVVRRGKTWQLLAASGVDRIETRADVTKRLEELADKAACWGEPIEFADTAADGQIEPLPPDLLHVVEQHLDQSHARRLVVVPIDWPNATDDSPARRCSAVLVAEQFNATADELSRQLVVELAQMSASALRHVLQLDRFPLRGALRWADRWQRLTQSWGLTRVGVAIAAVVTLMAALVLIRTDFEIAAPATLVPRVERNVFATANGTILEVRVKHGDQVESGDVLAVLDDPQLALDTQRVRGEINATTKRLEAIAVSRTDRRVQEEASNEQLSLSAEAEQLRRRLESLKQQLKILDRRRASLALRSPIAGQVLTLDIYNLLIGRPVERGQAIFAIADLNKGWKLLAEVDQDRIGHVVAARQGESTELPVRFRLAGELGLTFTGQVESVAAITVLKTDDLDQCPPAVPVHIVVDAIDLPAARPGMNAEVRIDCGRRSLGYVWLHEACETVYSWLVF